MSRNYKKLDIWKDGYQFAIRIYKLTDRFPKDEINNLISQMRRAAVSIPLNIAEGCGRNTDSAFLQYILYAYGSAKELETLIMLSKDLGYIAMDEFLVVHDQADKLCIMLYKFSKSIEKNTRKAKTIRKFKLLKYQ